jgi:DUF1680 family protein
MEVTSSPDRRVRVELGDQFWAPRWHQLREHTLVVLLERMERHGVVDNFRRLAGRSPAAQRRGLWFTDSDLYKWIEAACLAGRADLADPIVEVIVATQSPDGYLNTYYGHDTQPRYGDLGASHELYCIGHLIEAAIEHERATGTSELLDTAVRAADHLCATFGPGLDERVDGHPEVELALARLAVRTGTERYLHLARWMIEQTVEVATFELGGHAVRSLYLASGIAEVALATGDDAYAEATRRLFASLDREHSYPTGAVGGRWMGEAVGRPFELPADSSYAESCAAVAAAQFAWRYWRLTGDTAGVDRYETILYNAMAAGVGADGESWFYSQPHAATGDREVDPWVSPLDFQASMLDQWFPPRRHSWFDVTCCPTNLARGFAQVPEHVAALDHHGQLVVHLPIASRLRGGGWDVEVGGAYPWDGQVTCEIHTAPTDGRLVVRVPGWAGGRGLRDITAAPRIDLPVAAEWWRADPRATSARGQVFLRRGPVVYCGEEPAGSALDLRRVRVDAHAPALEREAPLLAGGVWVVEVAAHLEPPLSELYVPLGDPPQTSPVELTLIPYATWANRGPSTMSIWFGLH